MTINVILVFIQEAKFAMNVMISVLNALEGKSLCAQNAKMATSCMIRHAAARVQQDISLMLTIMSARNVNLIANCVWVHTLALNV